MGEFLLVIYLIAAVPVALLLICFAVMSQSAEGRKAIPVVIDKMKADWAAKQEAKKKSQEETAGKIVDWLGNIMKKHS